MKTKTKTRISLMMMTLCLWFVTGCTNPDGYTFHGGIPSSEGNPVGLNQDVLVIYVRASDDATSGLASLRTSEEAEFTTVNTYFLEQSFNKCSFNYTHAPNTGWYQLGKTYDDYIWTQADINAANATGDANAIQQAQDGQALLQDFSGFFTDALQAATNDGFNVSNFSQICAVIIGPFFRGTSYSTTNFTLKDASNNNFQVSLPVVIVSTNTGWQRTAHEFGHAFGKFRDLYNSPNRRMGQWDIMDCTDCSNQTTGWHKEVKATWLPPGNIKVIDRPIGTTQIIDVTTLLPYETQNPNSNDILSIKLNVGGNMHLYIENRQTISGHVSSQQLPANAVIISDADDDAQSINASRPPILLFGGPITTGNTFTDNSYGPLEIEVSGSNPNLTVKTTWGPDPFFDLMINKWNPPPYESADIWIDSEANGWDTYENQNAAQNPGVAGNPIRNGDRPWVGKDNRVYARVHNIGSTDVSNVTVNYYVNTPQGIGDDGNWSLLERKTIPFIAAGSNAIAPFAIWKPSTSNATHTCLRVVVDYKTGELNANNNEAQENISAFNTSSSSPWSMIESEIRVGNPTDRYQQVKLEMTGLPRGWTGWVQKRFISLAPKETTLVKYRIDPNGGSNKVNKELKPGMKFDINIDGWLIFDDHEVNYGGITVAAHTVIKSNKLEIDEKASEKNKSIVIVLTTAYNLPVTTFLTLEFTEKQSGERRVVLIPEPTKIDNNRMIFSVDTRNNKDLGIYLKAGQTYDVTAYIYGNHIVDGGIESRPYSYTHNP